MIDLLSLLVYTLFLVILISYIYTFLIGPGVGTIPEHYIEDIRENNEVIDEILEKTKSEPELRGKAWCSICCAWRYEGTHHCRTCNVCVPMLDHHCVFFDGCVGQKNHTGFLIFISSIAVECIIVQAVLFYIHYHLSSVLVGNILIMMLFSIALGVILIPYSIYNIYHHFWSKTTYIQRKRLSLSEPRQQPQLSVEDHIIASYSAYATVRTRLNGVVSPLQASSSPCPVIFGEHCPSSKVSTKKKVFDFDVDSDSDSDSDSYSNPSLKRNVDSDEESDSNLNDHDINTEESKFLLRPKQNRIWQKYKAMRKFSLEDADN